MIIRIVFWSLDRATFTDIIFLIKNMLFILQDVFIYFEVENAPKEDTEEKDKQPIITVPKQIHLESATMVNLTAKNAWHQDSLSIGPNVNYV